MNQIPQKICLLPLLHFSPPPAFSLFESLKHFPFTFWDLCLTLLYPFLSCWKPKQSPSTGSTAYREVSLEDSRQLTCILCLAVWVQQIWPAVLWRDLAHWNHPVQWYSVFSLLSSLRQHIGWLSWLEGAVSTSLLPQPLHLLHSLSHPAENKYFLYGSFLLLALAYQYQQT